MFSRISKSKNLHIKYRWYCYCCIAAVTNITIVAYDLDGLTVKNHVFKPTKKLSIAINEVYFINGHYELFVDALAQAELEYESIIFKQDFKTSAKETLQKCPPSKTQHSLQFFSSTQNYQGKNRIYWVS